MSLRRAGTLLLAFALVACHTVNQGEQTPELIFATFNSTTGAIPIPNDLVLQNVGTVSPAAQKELLQGFIKSGGFPSDQEVAITIPFNRVTWDATAGVYAAAAPPALDMATVTSSTVALLKVDVSPPAAVAYEASYDATKGLLTLRKPAVAGARHWASGRYVVAVRGGAGGVKAVGGALILPDTAIELALQGKDLTNPANQPPGMTPALAAQVEGLRQTLVNPLDWQGGSGTWTPAPSGGVTPALTAVDGVFPHLEVAVVATFGIDRSAHLALDPAAGQAPFPSDFMLDFTPAHCPTGVAPCLAAALAPAFGPAGTPLRTLDGFSTTALLLAPLTGPVDADTITGANVHLFELPAASAPVQLKDLVSSAPTFAGAAYVLQPSSFNQTVGAAHLTTTLALAPAVPAQVSASVTLAMPPLKEKSRYAVVVTNRVKNASGTPMTRSTVGNILLSTSSPLTDGVSTSFLAGVDFATAAGLQAARDQLAPFLAALPALTGGATTKDDVVMVYTVTTQSVTGTSVQLSVAPLSIEQGAGAAIFTPTAAAAFTPPPGVPTTNVNGFFTVTFKSVDGIDKTTGAFRPTLATDLATPATLATLLTDLHALIAIPDAAVVPACPSPPFPAGAKCAKVVVFGHGLNGDRTNMLATAASLASAGFIAAAIDFPLHGERNWCATNANCTTDGVADGVCTPFTGGAGQGDAVPPGVCTTGVPRTAASRYFISGNFFRVRDAFRQNLFDQAALALALARPPAPFPQPAGNPVTALLPAGVIVDPSAVYYEGLSLGSLAGTSVVATNPRITRASLSVGGGPIVDVFSTSPSFQGSLDALFATLIPGYSRAAITPGDPAFSPTILAEYIQLLSVAKWILDPGDPINYAGHVRTSPFPNLLANPNGSVPQPAKDVFAQIALGDLVVPNPTNILLDTLIGGHTTTYSLQGGPAPHAMLATVPSDVPATVKVQTDAATFLVDPAVFPAASVDLP